MMASDFTKDNLKEVADPFFSLGGFSLTRELSPRFSCPSLLLIKENL
jgi:hypothetical protein